MARKSPRYFFGPQKLVLTKAPDKIRDTRKINGVSVDAGSFFSQSDLGQPNVFGNAARQQPDRSGHFLATERQASNNLQFGPNDFFIGLDLVLQFAELRGFSQLPGEHAFIFSKLLEHRAQFEHTRSRPAGSWSPVVDHQTSRVGGLRLVASVSTSPDAFRNACSCS